MDRPSDAEPLRAVTDDGSLYAASNATGDPVDGDDEVESVEQNERWIEREHTSNPNALIEGNRVATAEDME